MNPLQGETVLDVAEGGAFVSRATDPLILPQPYARPADFTAQYPQPLDTAEIIAMCEEVNLLSAIPEIGTSLNSELWREMTSLAFTSGSSYVSFADGACPEEYTHNGSNTTVDLKNIGAKKTLSVRDIMHSTAVAAGGMGINRLVGGFPAGEGLPGGADAGSFQQQVVAGVKEKEVRLAATLVLNGEDRLLVQGNTANNSLEYTGIENWSANFTCAMHTGSVTAASGSFSGASFDQFLSEGCAKPTALFGHPAAIQEMMSAYFQLGFQGSQLVNFPNGDRIIPGFNFAGFVNTGVGRLAVVADNNFRKTVSGATTFQADIWALRMTHNGEPLVYRSTQIPLSVNDLAPGCTAVSFEVWKATALVIKACCAQGKYTALFSGRIVTTCTAIG